MEQKAFVKRKKAKTKFSPFSPPTPISNNNKNALKKKKNPSNPTLQLPRGKSRAGEQVSLFVFYCEALGKIGRVAGKRCLKTIIIIIFEGEK